MGYFVVIKVIKLSTIWQNKKQENTSTMKLTIFDSITNWDTGKNRGDNAALCHRDLSEEQGKK